MKKINRLRRELFLTTSLVFKVLPTGNKKFGADEVTTTNWKSVAIEIPPGDKIDLSISNEIAKTAH